MEGGTGLGLGGVWCAPPTPGPTLEGLGGVTSRPASPLRTPRSLKGTAGPGRGSQCGP